MEEGVLHAVSGTWKHPHYSRDTVYNDIGLIRVNKKFVYTNSVGAVKLPTTNFFDNSQEPANVYESCVSMGWGKTQEYGNNSILLEHVVLPLITNAECSRLVMRGTYLRSTQMCTMYRFGGKDTCQGDSGGPLVCNEVQVSIFYILQWIPNSANLCTSLINL